MKHFILQDDLDTYELEDGFGVTVIDKDGYKYFNFTDSPILEYDETVDEILKSWESYITKKHTYGIK